MGAQKKSWVVLNTGESTIHYDARPKRLAIGHYKYYLPIVVICASGEDGEEVMKLHSMLWGVDPNDRDAILKAFDNDQTRQTLSHVRALYAVRYGSETGIYAVPWKDVEHSVAYTGAKWSKNDDLYEAIKFMLDKPKPPLLGMPETPSSPKKKAVKFSSPEVISRSASLPELFSSSPTQTPPEVKVMARKAAGKTFAKRNAPSSPSSPSSSHARTAGTMARSTSPLKYSAYRNNEDDEDNDEDNNGYSSDDGLAAAMQASLAMPAVPPPHIQYLRSLLRPLALPGYRGHAVLPISLGSQAEAYLRARGCTDEQVLQVLQARVYADDIPGFSYVLGLKFGWSALVTTELWQLIELPTLSD
ncbi:hypothetical protein BV20DRAFT_1058471 [Pilatotrama ljubarskyi]|nr:hypothetical protein BV20DRAFT_1058471 [Pilatotrama ljubarskyi]